MHNLDLKDIHDNKFLDIGKFLFYDMIRSAENIYVDESVEIVRNEEEVNYIFNECFVNMVRMIGITITFSATYTFQTLLQKSL